ncbi:MAG TPA: Rieske 2Fe-2S domain-containing protein [Candidatus Binatia bacterium]|nr:Rieske 2Fe-2S domain-containing protein [Candidatus Binatia bacterium]
MARVRVARASEVPAGTGKVVEVGGHSLALFNVDGVFYAIDNACPHRGGPLGEGEVDGRVVTCPWHAWRWDVTTGCHVNNPALRVACFPVSIEGDDVIVELRD